MRIVTAAIVEKDGRILIARRAPGGALAGKWEFPGGKLEEGETPEQCLYRELREEFGIESEVGDLVASSTFDYVHGSIELLAFRVRHTSCTFVPTVHDALEWVSRAELCTYDFAPADMPIVDKLVAEKGL
jgi:8-oxo-dGTP diphosphatase